MLFKSNYYSTLGNFILLSDENHVLGVWFEKQKYCGRSYDLSQIDYNENNLIKHTKQWLDAYFSGENPSINELSLQPKVTPFQKKVLEILKNIPYGTTITYQEIANQLQKKSAARAVGGAVGRNPISIIIPCHRVIGTNGSLTGYAGGLQLKKALLSLENSSAILSAHNKKTPS